MKFIIVIVFIGSVFFSFAQNIGINATGVIPSNSAMLDVSSTDKGLLIPRVDIIDLSTALPISAPAVSLLVYNTNATSGIGYYYWNGTSWTKLIDASSNVDNDWYEVGTSNAPNDINDNIFTNGNVGIGINTPQNTLVVSINNSTATSVTVEGYGASKPDINALLFGSDFGGLIQGGKNGHLVLGIRDNEASDGVLIASGGGNYNSDQVYDTPVLFAKADGRTGFGTVSPNTRIHVRGETFGLSSVYAERIEETSAGPGFFGRHARGSFAGETAAMNGDNAVSFGGVLHDGTSFNTIGFMNFYADGDQVAANHAGNFRIRLAQANGNTASRMTILSNGNTGVGVTAPLERLDVNGDLYVRGDDVYFSHDATPNLNNDYVHFNDINTLNFGGRSIFSFHADVPRNDPAHDWSNPTGSISFDGAYATGKIGMNTTNPQASIDINNGYVISDRFWYKDYVVSNTNTATVLARDGSPLPTNFVGLLFCSVNATNNLGTSYWMVKKSPNGTVSIEKIASFGSTGTNVPEIYNSGGVIKIRLYATTLDYTVRVRTEQMW